MLNPIRHIWQAATSYRYSRAGAFRRRFSDAAFSYNATSSRTAPVEFIEETMPYFNDTEHLFFHVPYSSTARKFSLQDKV